jgi:hypothetical protein
VARAAAERARRRRRGKIAVEVVWADIGLVHGDVHVVGHYEGVMPQAAERALDIAISGLTGNVAENDPRLVLTDMTDRGILRGALGDVTFVPWGRRNIVAVAGMGRPGTFQENEVRQLWRSVARTVGRLPRRRTITTVLVGSGVGNLDLMRCVRQMLAGVSDAVDEEPALRIGCVRIVERELGRALKILEELRLALKQESRRHGARFHERRTLRAGRGGIIPRRFGYAMLLAALAKSSGLPPRSRVRKALESLLQALPPNVSPDRFWKELERRARGNPDYRQSVLGFELSDGKTNEHSASVPDRVTYSFDGSRVRCTAITNTSTVTERELGSPFSLVTRSIERLNTLAVDSAGRQTILEEGVKLYRALVHRDLEAIIKHERSLIIELDRQMASVQWEMLAAVKGEPPLGVRRVVARQLRTTFSPTVAVSGSRPVVSALVIVDPANPLPGPDLLGCRIEAEQVVPVLVERGLKVKLCIGAAEIENGPGPVEGAEVADLNEAISDLISGEFDVVHYCGHALFDPKRPDQTGWAFAGDFLTARYLEQMQRAPLLVFANACQTARLATPPASAPKRPGESQPPVRSDAGLVAGLADQFLKQGVPDYIGTGWEVRGKAAGLFAATFYKALLGSDPQPLGDAIKQARNALYEKRATFGANWAAYQHYGDPTRTFSQEK